MSLSKTARSYPAQRVNPPARQIADSFVTNLPNLADSPTGPRRLFFSQWPTGNPSKRIPAFTVRFVGCLLVAAGLVVSGCTRPGPSDSQLQSPPSLADQLKTVARGETDTIIAGAVTADDLALLSKAAGLRELVIDRAAFSGEALQQLSTLPKLEKLELRGQAFGDASLQHLAKIPTLQWINIPGENVTDRGMKQLASLEKLRILNLHQTQITDVGLAALKDHQQLELLRLGSPNITDHGMKYVAGIRSLRFLHLMEIPITDAGLEPLKQMTWLESFYLDGGHCSDEGLSRLLTALPKLHFHKDQQHLYTDPRRGMHGH